jgi:hypothetical protein
METRLTLRPDMPGTKRLVARYGERLACRPPPAAQGQ